MHRHESSACAGPPIRSRRARPPARRARPAGRATANCRPTGTPYRIRSAGPRAPPSGPLEPRRSLLDARHLRFDDVLTGPSLVEQVLVLWPLLLVGAIVV